jgi:hypothetical protein
LLAAVASRVERLKHLARETPDAPASVELSPAEIGATLLLKRQHKKRTETVPDSMPTIAQPMRDREREVAERERRVRTSRRLRRRLFGRDAHEPQTRGARQMRIAIATTSSCRLMSTGRVCCYALAADPHPRERGERYVASKGYTPAAVKL